MKVSELLVARPMIEKLAGKEMHAAAAIEFANFAREAMAIIKDFENKRADLFKKYGEQVDEEGNWKIKEENEKKFKSAIDRAMKKDVGLEPFDLVSSGVSVTPAEIVNNLGLFK